MVKKKSKEKPEVIWKSKFDYMCPSWRIVKVPPNSGVPGSTYRLFLEKATEPNVMGKSGWVTVTGDFLPTKDDVSCVLRALKEMLEL